MPIVEATGRYLLLKTALENVKMAEQDQYSIRILPNKIIFTCNDNIITEYDRISGDITDNNVCATFFTHLDYDLVLDVLRNAKALEMAYYNEILNGPCPVKSFLKLPHQNIIDKSWFIISSPTKVKKHNQGKDYLLTIPIRRSDREKMNLNPESWIVYAIKEIPAPINPTRQGGSGPRQSKS